jgi:hypothetical protein
LNGTQQIYHIIKLTGSQNKKILIVSHFGGIIVYVKKSRGRRCFAETSVSAIADLPPVNGRKSESPTAGNTNCRPHPEASRLTLTDILAKGRLPPTTEVVLLLKLGENEVFKSRDAMHCVSTNPYESSTE